MNVTLSKHATIRFNERVRPTLLPTAAERELRALTNQGTLQSYVPWRDEGECDAYLLLADGVALTLKHNKSHWIATSCLVRCGLSPEKREARKRRRQARQNARFYRHLNGKSRSPEWYRETFGKQAA